MIIVIIIIIIIAKQKKKSKPKNGFIFLLQHELKFASLLSHLMITIEDERMKGYDRKEEGRGEEKGVLICNVTCARQTVAVYCVWIERLWIYIYIF